ncbi:MAG: C40 family peptidase [Deltaproteobacteria bacterium]|nr:C40 family peptidase [Deltaproteobacteria bacterium]
MRTLVDAFLFISTIMIVVLVGGVGLAKDSRHNAPTNKKHSLTTPRKVAPKNRPVQAASSRKKVQTVKSKSPAKSARILTACRTKSHVSKKSIMAQAKNGKHEKSQERQKKTLRAGHKHDSLKSLARDKKAQKLQARKRGCDPRLSKSDRKRALALKKMAHLKARSTDRHFQRRDLQRTYFSTTERSYSDDFTASNYSSSNQALADSMKSYLGTPYRSGGESPTGTDCSGFVSLVFRTSLGVDLPRGSANLFHIGSRVERDELKFGDLVFFKIYGDRISHVGIYFKGGKFIHAARKRGVEIADLDDEYWRKRYVSAKRIVNLDRSRQPQQTSWNIFPGEFKVAALYSDQANGQADSTTFR